MSLRSLTFQHQGRRHLLVPVVEGRNAQRGREAWERVVGDRVVLIVRAALKSHGAGTDAGHLLRFWRSLSHHGPAGSHGSRDLIEAILREARANRFVLLREPVRDASSAVPPAPPPVETPPEDIPLEPVEPKRVVSIQWATREVWCSEGAEFHGTTKRYSDGEKIDVTAQEHRGAAHKAGADVAGNSFRGQWLVRDVLPPLRGDHYAREVEVDAMAGGQITPEPVKVRFAPGLNKVLHKRGHHTWSVEVDDFTLRLEEIIEFVPGWAGQKVYLADVLPANSPALLHGELEGYCWMKMVGTKPRYWDGKKDWIPLPAGFELTDHNHDTIGFFKVGNGITSMEGGMWPQPFTEWDITSPDHQRKIAEWERVIHDTWTGKVDLKRKGCLSSKKDCCRYNVVVDVKFKQVEDIYKVTLDTMIIAYGYIRANDMLLFIGNRRYTTAPHEFGHHIGNDDEYYQPRSGDPKVHRTKPPVVDGLDRDGIDESSIMGAASDDPNFGRTIKVKKRHLTYVAGVFGNAMSAAYGKSWGYEPVDP